MWGDGEAVRKRRPATGPEDGRRNRKVRKMLHQADHLQAEAEAEAKAEAEAEAEAGVDDQDDHEIQNQAEAVQNDPKDIVDNHMIEDSHGNLDNLPDIGKQANEEEEGPAHHLDADVIGLEGLEQELRGLHGEGMFAGMDD